MCARFEGWSLAFSGRTLQLTSRNNAIFLLCSQIPVCLFGLSLALFFVCASHCVFLFLSSTSKTNKRMYLDLNYCIVIASHLVEVCY